MSQDKDFDIDSLINAEPPHTSSIADLGLVEDAVEVAKPESKKEEAIPKEKKSLFGSKKESKPKELKPSAPSDGKKKKMVMMITLIGMIGVVGSVGYQQVKQKNQSPSPFPTMPEIAKPAPQSSLAQPNPNMGLPAGIKKAEMTPPVPTPAQMTPPTSPTSATEPVKEAVLPPTHAENSADSLPKVDAKPQSGGDAILEEQKNALAKILNANASMAEGNLSTTKDEPVKATPKNEPIANTPQHVKELPSAIKSAIVPPHEMEAMKHEIRQSNNKVRELEIVELSSRYLKANVNGKVLKYEVGDLLPGNAKILRIDINNEKVYTNKGNIVIR